MHYRFWGLSDSCLAADEQYDGIAYRTLFATDTRQWETLTLPFDGFSASFRGKPVPGAPVLQPEQIRQIGFLLADKQPGSFCLEIAWIKSFQAYKI